MKTLEKQRLQNNNECFESLGEIKNLIEQIKEINESLDDSLIEILKEWEKVTNLRVIKNTNLAVLKVYTYGGDIYFIKSGVSGIYKINSFKFASEKFDESVFCYLSELSVPLKKNILTSLPAAFFDYIKLLRGTITLYK